LTIFANLQKRQYFAAPNGKEMAIKLKTKPMVASAYFDANIRPQNSRSYRHASPSTSHC
jgi:hypothetical protein